MRVSKQPFVHIAMIALCRFYIIKNIELAWREIDRVSKGYIFGWIFLLIKSCTLRLICKSTTSKYMVTKTIYTFSYWNTISIIKCDSLLRLVAYALLLGSAKLFYYLEKGFPNLPLIYKVCLDYIGEWLYMDHRIDVIRTKLIRIMR